MKRALLIAATFVACSFAAGAAHAEFQVGMCGLGRYFQETGNAGHHLELWAQSDPRHAPEARVPLNVPAELSGTSPVSTGNCRYFAVELDSWDGLWEGRDYRVMIVDMDRGALEDPRDPYIVWDAGYRNFQSSPVLNYVYRGCSCRNAPAIPIDSIDDGGLIGPKPGTKALDEATASTWGALKGTYR